MLLTAAQTVQDSEKNRPEGAASKVLAEAWKENCKAESGTENVSSPKVSPLDLLIVSLSITKNIPVGINK